MKQTNNRTTTSANKKKYSFFFFGFVSTSFFYSVQLDYNLERNDFSLYIFSIFHSFSSFLIKRKTNPLKMAYSFAIRCVWVSVCIGFLFHRQIRYAIYAHSNDNYVIIYYYSDSSCVVGFSTSVLLLFPIEMRLYIIFYTQMIELNWLSCIPRRCRVISGTG